MCLTGACGRAWVSAADDMTPLTNLLKEDWPVRAALGAQLLSIVEEMLEGGVVKANILTVRLTQENVRQH